MTGRGPGSIQETFRRMAAQSGARTMAKVKEKFDQATQPGRKPTKPDRADGVNQDCPGR